MVGVTPMIGNNDDSEVFSLANAKTLVAYAKQKQLGLVVVLGHPARRAVPGGRRPRRVHRRQRRDLPVPQIFAGVLP